MSEFAEQYAALEKSLEAQANADGDVFIPNVPPLGPVDFVIIGMEPSIKWAKSISDATNKVAGGFRNFMYSAEDFILHFAFTNYLCREGQTYHITDLSKGAMRVELADAERFKRWDRWQKLLDDEIRLVAKEDAKVFALGKTVAAYLASKPSPRLYDGLKNWNGDAGPCSTLLQHSGNATKWRSVCPVAHAGEFAIFENHLAKVDIEDLALKKLALVNPAPMVKQWIERRIRCFDLSKSRRQLLFTYKFQVG